MLIFFKFKKQEVFGRLNTTTRTAMAFKHLVLDPKMQLILQEAALGRG
jgi:hypothetical protein